MITAAMTKILGAQILGDVQTFVRAFEALFGGFRQRATSTFELLSSRHSTFLVVATPQHDALREAAYFVDRLTEEGMPLSGMVLNRVHTSALAISPERAAVAGRRPRGTSAVLEVEALRLHAALMRTIETRNANDGTLRGSSSGGGPDPGSVLADRRHRFGDTASRRRPVVGQGLRARRRRLRRWVRLADQDRTPRRDITPLPKQQPPLPLGHAPPDAPFDTVVQSLGQALEAHWASRTYESGSFLVGRLRNRHPASPALARMGPLPCLPHAASPFVTSPYRAFPRPLSGGMTATHGNFDVLDSFRDVCRFVTFVP